MPFIWGFLKYMITYNFECAIHGDILEQLFSVNQIWHVKQPIEKSVKLSLVNEILEAVS